MRSRLALFRQVAPSLWLVLAFAAALPPALAREREGSQEASLDGSEDAWGYVYVFRTMQVHALKGEEARIGRLAENHIVLTSPMVSRRHGVIRRSDAGVQFIDVGSSNGSRVNTRELRARFPVALEPGARIQIADELLLYQSSLPELWRDELRHRLLTGFVKLRLQLPQDVTRRSFGREEIVSNVTEARVSTIDAKIAVAHSVPLEERSGFPIESIAMIGHVGVERGTLELSLWALASASSMTGRRASLANLKHTTLRVTVDDDDRNGVAEGGRKGPWFPTGVLASLFEFYADDPDTALQFGTSLAEQERPIALRDAAESLAFRHRIDPSEWRLLLLAARAKASYVEREIAERSALLTSRDKEDLAEALVESRRWLDVARELGAEDDWAEDTVDAMARAEERLQRIQSR